MPFAVLTPIPATLNALPGIVAPPISVPHSTAKHPTSTHIEPNDTDKMSSHPSSPANRLKLHSTPSAASRAARDSIISSSAKGWSPLQINKRGDASPNPSVGSNPSSPLPHPHGATAVGQSTLAAPQEGPRRTSNSFKHVTKNSLVANSPFKDTSTLQGAQAAGLEVESRQARRDVIHERRAPGETRQLGQTLPSAKGAAATSKAEIGLGIGIPSKVRARVPSSSPGGSAVAGQRRVSGERSKVAVAIPRSAERKSSGSKENDSPDARGSGRKPRQSAALTGLGEHSYVSRSPFKAGGAAAVTAARAESPTPAPRHGSSISPRRASLDKASPASRSIRTSPSPTPSPPRHFSHSSSLGAGPSPLRGATLGPPRLSDECSSPSPSPTHAKSAMTPSRRLLGPRSAAIEPASPSKQAKTVTFQSVPDVKEFECMSIEGSADGSFEVPDFAHDAEEWEDDHEGEHEGDDSLEGILDLGRMDRAMGGMAIGDDSLVMHGDVSADGEGEGDADTMDEHGNGESTTANFLMEQGIFTPEPASAPTMPAQEVPDVPPIPAQHVQAQSHSQSQSQPRTDLQSRLQQLAVPAAQNALQHPTSPSLGTASTASSHAPCLSTPSFGGSIDLDPAPVFPELDEAGIPYGRSHHAERNALAHAQGPEVKAPAAALAPLESARLPKNGEHQMLLNGNVAEPALPISPRQAMRIKQEMDGPHAHQEGQFHDPFITIQTATAVLSPSSQQKEQARMEGGVPLGRTSHVERMNAARQLASQGIGLGLPRSPARMEEVGVDVRSYPQPPKSQLQMQPQPLSKPKQGKKQEEDVQSESGTEVESGDEGEVDDDHFFASPPTASRVAAQKEKERAQEEVKGYHPPRSVDLPAPVTVEAPKLQEKRASTLGLGTFNLPSISNTSPFFSQTPAFGNAGTVPSPTDVPATQIPHNRVPSNDPSEPSTAPSDDDRPLTPPAARPLSYADERKQGQKDDSPHRIPSLEFEAITFEKDSWSGEVKRAEVMVNPYSPEKGRKISAESTTTDALQAKSPSAATTLAPKETKVRQRISREMIRERIDKKYEEGSLSRRPVSMYASAAGAFGETGIKSSTSSGLSASTSAGSALSSSSTPANIEKRNSGYSTSVLPPTLSSESVDKQGASSRQLPPSPMRQAPRPTRPMSAFGALPSTVLAQAAEGGTGKNKALPTPPMATPMQKSATEIPSIPAVSISAPSPASKTGTPTTATFTSVSTSVPNTPSKPAPAVGTAPAMDQIQRSAKSGSEPKSALDKLISNVLPKPKRSQTADGAQADKQHRSPSGHKYLPGPGAARPVGILQNPTGRLSSQTVPTLGAEVVGDGNERGTPTRVSSMLPPPKGAMDGAERGGPGMGRPKSDIPVGSAEVSAKVQAQTSRPLPKPSNGQAQEYDAPAIDRAAAPAGHAPKARNVSGISLVSVGSKKGRRSMSMSDANAAAGGEGDDDVPLAAVKTRKQPRLTLGLKEEKTSMSEAFREEMESINTERGYKIKERKVQPAAYSGTVTHPKAGDIERGKAWRQVRRPSDIYEHAAEMRARKEGETGADKATGTIFVKVLGIESLGVPVPVEATAFCVELDNGIDYIKTSYMRLAEGARVNQEFALVEQPNFSFSLSLVLRRDPHILRLQEQERVYHAQLAQHQQMQRQPSQPNRTPTSASRQPSLALPQGNSKGGGLKGFLRSPRKPKTTSSPSSAPSGSTLGSSNSAGSEVSAAGTTSGLRLPLPPAPRESIISYLPNEGSSTFAKTHISFKPIAKQCEAKVLEIRYPMFAMFKGEPERRTDGVQKPVDPTAPRKQVAKITLQVLRLPPLPGLTQEEMPQCIDECLRGMRHHAWHQCEYHEGTLTQQGGDLRSLRRRVFKLIGGRMVAWNESKQKEVVTIDLKHASAVVDLNPDLANMSPASKMTRMTSWDMDDEGYGMARPNSFRVDFDDGEAITFSADNKEEKARWMEALEGLLGKIPSNPLWAEVLAAKQREQREQQERNQMRSASRSTVTSSSGHSSSGVGAGSRTAERARAREGKGEEGEDMLAGRKGEGIV